MCPSYRATGDEQHSTRGRARLLWEMLSGALRKEGFQSEAVHQALELCLSCKACKSECPCRWTLPRGNRSSWHSTTKADASAASLHLRLCRPARALGFAHTALTNALLTGPLTSPLIKHIAGVAQERKLPRLAPRSYQKSRHGVYETANVPRSTNESTAPEKESASRTWQRWCSGPIRGTTTIIRRLWPPLRPCSPTRLPGGSSQRPHLLRKAALRLRPARRRPLLSREGSGPHGPADRSRAPFHLLEPSCASVFKDELLELFPNDAAPNE